MQFYIVKFYIMTINDRLSEFYEYLKKGNKLTQKDLAKKLELDAGYLSKVLNNKESIGLTIIEKFINNYSELNADWLMTGEGNMLKDGIGYVNEPQMRYGMPDDKERLFNTIEKISETNDRNSRSIEKMVDTADRNSQTLEKLVDLLYQNGVELPKAYQTSKKGASDRKERYKDDESYKSNAG